MRPAYLLVQVPRQRQYAVYSAPADGRDGQMRRLHLHPRPDALHCLVQVDGGDVPLVEQYGGGALRSLRLVGHLQVEVRQALAGVHHDQRHVAALQRLERAQGAEVLHIGGGPLARPAQTRRVHQDRAAPPRRSESVSIASRVVPGIADTMVRVSPKQRVEQGTLADVGSADDGHSHRGDLFLVTGVLGQSLDDLVQQVADPQPVLRRDAQRFAQAQLPVLVQACLAPSWCPAC